MNQRRELAWITRHLWTHRRREALARWQVWSRETPRDEAASIAYSLANDDGVSPDAPTTWGPREW